MQNYTDFITIDTQVRFGKSCIKGSRITVYDVLGWLASGVWTFRKLLLIIQN